MAHPLFAPEVRLMLEENNAAEIQAFCETLHPATVAETLAEDLQSRRSGASCRTPTSAPRRPSSSTSPSTGRSRWSRARASSTWPG